MDLINGKALTFLRRALSEDLAPINQVEVALSMGDSFCRDWFDHRGRSSVESR